MADTDWTNNDWETGRTIYGHGNKGRGRHSLTVRGFFPHLFCMPEEHIIRTNRLPSHVIFNLLQELKDNLGPSTRSHRIPGLSKLPANLHFLPSSSFQLTVASLFLTTLIMPMLICAALGILRWSIYKWDDASVFFNLRISCKSPTEMSTPIATVLELHSCANSPPF